MTWYEVQVRGGSSWNAVQLEITLEAALEGLRFRKGMHRIAKFEYRVVKMTKAEEVVG